MTAALLAALISLSLMRSLRLSGRPKDRGRLAGLLGAAAILLGTEPVSSRIDAVLADGSARVLSLNFFLAATWCIRGMIINAVRRGRHAAATRSGLFMLCAACLLNWGSLAVISADGVLATLAEACTLNGLVFEYHLMVTMLYVSVCCFTISSASLTGMIRARTSGVQAGSFLLAVAAAALAITAAFRVATHSFVLHRAWAGSPQTGHAADFDSVSATIMLAAGLLGVLGLAVPPAVVLWRWLGDVRWANSRLGFIKPLWERAAAVQPLHHIGARLTPRTDPMAKLHRWVVEIRDAELSQGIQLHTGEKRVIESIEAKLFRGAPRPGGIG